MASPSRTLKLTYLGDASQLKKENAEVEKGFGRVGDRIKKFGKIAAVGLAVAAGATVAVGKKLFAAAEAAGTANARIENITQSMGNFGKETQQVTKRITTTAESFAKLTGVQRNTIKETQALLLTFNSVNKTADETGGIFDRATKAAIDLAAAGFGSATTNAQQLGKALEDPIKGLTALTRSGVTFTEAERERIKVLVESNEIGEAQALILEAIETQVGGTAEATSNASDRMRESFGVLVDQIALSLQPEFDKLTDFVARLIEKFAEWWQDNGPKVIENIGKIVTAAGELIATIRDFLVPIFTDFIDRAKQFYETNAPQTKDALEDIKTSGERVATEIAELNDLFFGLFGTMDEGTKEEGGLFTFGRFMEGLAAIIGLVGEAVINVLQPVRDLLELLDRVVNNPIVRGIGSLTSMVYSNLGVIRNRAEQVQEPLTNLQGPQRFTPLLPPTQGPRVPSTSIVVNGAVDAEGTARQIRKILDDSTRRVGAQQSAVFAP